MRLARFACFALLLAGVPCARADEDRAEALSKALRPLLLEAFPPVLYEEAKDWGRQKLVANGVRWHGLRPEIMKGPRNDGHWQRTRVVGQDLPRTLELRITELRNVDAERQTFRVFLAFQAHVERERQHWENGLRLSSASVRARLRIKVILDCETTLRVEPTKSLLPDVVFRMRVTHAELGYDNLVVEHVGGMGGTAARLMGEALRSSLKQWKPSLERDLLARASAAVVRAADTREVRITLNRQPKGGK